MGGIGDAIKSGVSLKHVSVIFICDRIDKEKEEEKQANAEKKTGKEFQITFVYLLQLPNPKELWRIWQT